MTNDGGGENEHSEHLREIDLADVIQPTSRPLEEQRERVRGKIALALLGLLSFEVAVSIIVIWWSSDPIVVSKTMDWLSTVITPTVALFGAATGFYFGTKSHG